MGTDPARWQRLSPLLDELLELPRDGRAGAERFEQEGRILARLSHQNIARLVDAGVMDGQPYLVLERVEETRSMGGAKRGPSIATPGAGCSSPSWTRSPTRTRASSCTATSSPRTSW